MKNINDYIIEFDNIIPDCLVDDIFCEYENSSEWAHAVLSEGVVDHSIRNVNTIPLSVHHNTNTDVRKKIDNQLFKCAGEAIQKYNKAFPYATIVQDSGYELLRYQPGQFYKQHTDSFKIIPRSVSCSFILNDNYEGGEFAFFDEQLKIKPKKKSALMFPSNFMYPHAIMPVTKGIRYSIITWFV